MNPIPVELVKEVPGLTRDELALLLGGDSLRMPDHEVIVGAELGVQRGEFAEKLLLSGVGKLLLVDCWARQGEQYRDIANVPDSEQAKNLAETRSRMAQFPTRSHFLIGYSVPMAAEVPDGSLDFIYVDADHKYASVKADLAAWGPKVRSGGIISGHDYLDSENCCGSEFGVKSAVREYAASLGVDTIFQCQTDGPFHNWYFVKP